MTLHSLRSWCPRVETGSVGRRRGCKVENYKDSESAGKIKVRNKWRKLWR